MTRLIDADKLRERMYHDAFEVDSDLQKWDAGCWIRYKMFENAIDEQPTVEAVPVKHGHWLRPKGKEYGVCGNCGMNRVDLLDGYEHNYCEVCGAKMEGVEEV